MADKCFENNDDQQISRQKRFMGQKLNGKKLADKTMTMILTANKKRNMHSRKLQAEKINKNNFCSKKKNKRKKNRKEKVKKKQF